MNTARGSFVALATSPGRTASDNSGDTNGLYTKYLVQQLREPGLKLQDVFARAAEAVDRVSSGRQLPWSASSVIGEFYFRAPAPAAPTSPTPSVTAPVQTLPRPVGDTQLDLSDLAKRAEAENAWADYQSKLAAAFQSAEQFERGAVSAELKATAWERFLSAYAQDNPLSNEDDRLKGEAAMRANRWKAAPSIDTNPLVATLGGSLAIVDMQRIAQASRLGKSYAAKMDTLEAEIRSEQAKRQAVIDREPNESRRQAAASAAQAKIKEMQTAAQNKAQEFVAEFNTQMRPVLSAVGRAAGTALIIDKATVVDVGATDLTDDVIAKSDLQLPARLKGPLTLAAPNLAVVDMVRIAQESRLGKSYAAKMDALEAEIRSEQAKRQAVIDREPNESRRQAAASAAEARIKEMQTAAQGKVREFQVEFNTKIRPALVSAGRSLGASLLVDTALVIPCETSIDITADVVRIADGEPPTRRLPGQSAKFAVIDATRFLETQRSQFRAAACTFGADVVFDKGSVVVVDSALDITDAVSRVASKAR